MQYATLPTSVQLKLAALNAHRSQDRVLARRLRLLELLEQGKPLTRETIFQYFDQDSADVSWGNNPDETLQRDINVLRKGGIQIGYSRQKGLAGYFLQYPAFRQSATEFNNLTPDALIDAIKAKPIAEKLSIAFSMAEFALEQKRLLIKHENNSIQDTEADKEARLLVFGVEGRLP